LTFNDRVRDDALVTERIQELGLPDAVTRVIARAMLSRPEDRIGTAPEFAQRIREALKVRATTSIAPVVDTTLVRTQRIEIKEAAKDSNPPDDPAQRRPPFTTLQLALPSGEDGDSARASSAPERVVSEGQRLIRYVQVHERLDLSFVDAEGGLVRFRVTMLPTPSPSVNMKGLSCFVARQNQRPTSALTVNQDSRIDLVSSTRQILGSLTLSFGRQTSNGRVFVVDGRQLLVPYQEAQQAVTLTLSSGTDVVVMCRS